jgi:hypothetical protein
MRLAMTRSLALTVLCRGLLVAFVLGTIPSTAYAQDNIFRLSAASAQNQAAQVGTAFAENMSVRVSRLDTGASVPGAQVTFTAPSSGPSGTFATTGTNTVTATSGANGLATAPVFTANNQAGSYSVQVTTPQAAPNFFFFTNTQNPANLAFLMSIAGGSNQAAQINTTFAIALAVTVLNGSNALLPGITVTFSAPTSGPSGTFANGTTTTTAVTGATGLATASAPAELVVDCCSSGHGGATATSSTTTTTAAAATGGAAGVHQELRARVDTARGREQADIHHRQQGKRRRCDGPDVH